MARKGVPYGGGICGLKERIAELFDLVGEKLRSVNGVEGDGAGDLKIESGDAAVVISSDRIGHKIKVGLDASKLPAAVSSVNGQTGAVRLDAADIPSDGDSNVQADLAAEASARQAGIDAEASARQTSDSALQSAIDAEASARAKAVSDEAAARVRAVSDEASARQDADSAVQASIDAEASARQAADAALQTNIDSARASIPEMSMTPDPYRGVERDAQGRAFAADPASGATDKTLVTANWVSQSGNDAPNNLVHKIGNETKNGTLQLNNGYIAYRADWHPTAPITTPIDSYSIFVKITPVNAGHFAVFDFIQGSNNATEAGRLMLHITPSSMNPIWLYRKSRGADANLSNPDNIVCLTDGTYIYLAWKRTAKYGAIMSASYIQNIYGVVTYYDRNIEWLDGNTAIVTDDLSAYTVVTPID